MADGHDQAAREAAERALDGLHEIGADFREAAILDATGGLLAASTDAEWERRVAELWSAAEEGSGAAPAQLHVATETAEVFAVRSPAGASIVAVTPRYALESLMFCDLRAVLRQLDAEVAPA